MTARVSKKWRAGELVNVQQKGGRLLPGTVVQDQGESAYVYVAIVDPKDRWTLFYPGSKVRRSRRKDRLDPESRAWIQRQIDSHSFLKEAPPDDSIYRRGFAVGLTRVRGSSGRQE